MDAKEKIIKTLNDFGKNSTSRIAGIVGIDYVYAIKLLNELEQEEKVERQEVANAIYWKLKKGGKVK